MTRVHLHLGSGISKSRLVAAQLLLLSQERAGRERKGWRVGGVRGGGQGRRIRKGERTVVEMAVGVGGGGAVGGIVLLKLCVAGVLGVATQTAGLVAVVGGGERTRGAGMGRKRARGRPVTGREIRIARRSRNRAKTGRRALGRSRLLLVKTRRKVAD